MDPIVASDTRLVHEDQAERVAASVLHRAPRKYLVRCSQAVVARESVRDAVEAELKKSGMTHASVAEAAALAVDRAIAVIGVEVAPDPPGTRP